MRRRAEKAQVMQETTEANGAAVVAGCTAEIARQPQTAQVRPQRHLLTATAWARTKKKKKNKDNANKRENEGLTTKTTTMTRSTERPQPQCANAMKRGKRKRNAGTAPQNGDRGNSAAQRKRLQRKK